MICQSYYTPIMRKKISDPFDPRKNGIRQTPKINDLGSKNFFSNNLFLRIDSWK